MLDSILYFLDQGLLSWSWWQIALYTLATTHITIAAVTIYLHRCQAHRALELHPVVSHFFRGWLWLATGMVTKEWAAVHRKHHARCEQEGDPHSPQIFGIRKVLLQGTELYRIAAADGPQVEKFGHGTPNDWIERKLYTPHSIVGVTRVDDQHAKMRVRGPRKCVDQGIDRVEMPAPEKKQKIETLEPAATREMRLDRGGCGLPTGEAPIALGTPVAQLREGPGNAEGIALGGAHGRAVGFMVHANGKQVIAKIACHARHSRCRRQTG